MLKVKHLVYGRLRAPDLDAQEEFLTHFGMRRAARTERALYMRGSGPAHHIHVTELGETATVGVAFEAPDAAALEAAARIEGASAIEEIDEPGGGRRVNLTDPNGYRVEIVHGIAPLAPLQVRENPVNTGAEVRRVGKLTRLEKGPSHVRRLGHAVFATPKLEETVAWYRRNLGFIGSDEVYAGAKDNIILSFNRCDQGQTHVDHHTLMCIRKEFTGLNHLAFEVEDMDDLFIGHEYLKGLAKYEHMWGLGRHVLGSQCFDYWQDPFGRVHEHWTDIDLLDAATPTNLLSAEEGLGSQWGEPAPERFINNYSP